MAGERRQCSNCLRDIPSSKLELHESHCKRHMIFCSECDEVVPKTDMEEHQKEFHALTPCDLCGESMAKHKLDDHKDSTCIEAKVECKYCELDIRRGDYQAHSNQCGSRTDFCELCNQRVMLRDMSEHKETKCGHLRAESPLGETEVQEIMEDDYFNEGEDTYPFPGQQALPVDPQWLQTVAEACGEDNLDVVLAQNVFYENLRRVTHGETSYNQSDNYSNENVPEVADHTEYDDRTIAEHIQEDESEQRSYQVAKELQERELAYQAQLKRDADLARQLQDQQEYRQPEYKEQKYHSSYEHGSSAYEDEQPRPKPRPSSPVQDNEGKIPCQWCNQLFPIDQITQHQLSCYADMEPYNQHGGYSQPSDVSRKGDEPKSPPTEDKVPCQWCKQLFPFEQITQHQRECGSCYYPCQRCGGVHTHTPRRSESIPGNTPRETSELRMTKEVLDKVSTEEKIIESRHENSYTQCQFCGELQPESLVSIHEPICLKNPETHLKNAYTRTTGGFNSQSSPRPPPQPRKVAKNGSQQIWRKELDTTSATATESVVKVPCEFCEELIPINVLIRHQARCSVQQRIHRSTEPHPKPVAGPQLPTPATRQQFTSESAASAENKKNKLAIKFPSEQEPHHSNKSTPAMIRSKAESTSSIASHSDSSSQSLDYASLSVQGRKVQSSRSHSASSWKPNGNTKPGAYNT